MRKHKTEWAKSFHVLSTVYTDKSFDFVIKTPPVNALLMEYTKKTAGSAEPNRKKIGSSEQRHYRENRARKNARLELLYFGSRYEHGGRFCKKRWLYCRRILVLNLTFL
jgi:hypothetical protein